MQDSLDGLDGSDSREAKAERVNQRERLREMRIVLDDGIRQHNDLATHLGNEEIIVAYTMTQEDFNNMLEHVEQESSDGNSLEDNGYDKYDGVKD